MLKFLKKYYFSKGILSTNFTCQFKESCQANNQNFNGPKSSFVGSEYEKGILPRILFISLDPAFSNSEPESRTPEAVRDYEENQRDFSKLKKNRHWYRTHELAWYILKKYKSDLTIEQTTKYFAHVNSAKCSMNNPGHKKAKKRLFDNCRGYLKGEMEVLKPDVIVSQGNEAKEGVNSFAEERKRIDNYATEFSLNGRMIFWLHTYHPANWGAFNKQRSGGEGWERYSGII